MHGRQREKYAADELAVVLSRFDLGLIESITEFRRGSRRSPKVGVVSERGKFLLKRRPRGLSGTRRLDYAHRLQAHMASAGFPLPRLVPPRDEDGQVLHRDGYVYELFDYVRGQSYTGAGEETRHCGETLARFHEASQGFEHVESPQHGDYHDSNPVRTALNAAPTSLSAHDSVHGREGEVLALAQSLYDAYERSCGVVEDMGLREWPVSVVHGDWHPGNMLFRKHEVVAVIDYDSARRSQRALDLANGTLQFSILSSRRVEDWPDTLDEDRARLFLEGYASRSPIGDQEQACLPHLMVEALIAESVLPIAATGSFGHLQGFGFMKMVHRKVAWLWENAERLATALAVPR